MVNKNKNNIRHRKKMSHHLLTLFLPHQKNNYRPNILNPVVISAILVTAFLQQVSYTPSRVNLRGNVLAYATDINPVELLKDTNIERNKAGLAPLRLDSRLNASASDKASDMFSNDYWAHVSPSGVQPWHWFEVEHYAYSYAGENLAKNFDTSAGVMQGWMNSQTHRDNLLNIHYVDVGFSISNGTLQGEQTTLVVAHYGAAPQAPAPAPSPAPVVANTASHTPITTPRLVPAQTSVPAPVTAPAAVASPPVASTIPTLAPKAQVAPSTIVETSLPTRTIYSFFNPLSASKTLTASSKISLGLLLTLGFVMLMTHFTVWRRKLIHGFSHSYKLRATTEMAMIGAGIVIIIVRSFGSVT